MEIFKDYYDILQVPPNATKEQLKVAYKKAALKYHPDYSGNSTESNFHFILIKNAYQILSSSITKKVYDIFQAKHAKTTNQNIIETKDGIIQNQVTIFFNNQFNSIMWDIEDLFHRANHISFNKIYLPGNLFHDILVICLIIDKWTLCTVELYNTKDDVRNLAKGIIETAKRIHRRNNQLTNFGFLSVESYFFNLRIRMNEFLEKFSTYDLNVKMGNCEESRMEMWVELQDYIVYYLASITESMDMDKEIETEIYKRAEIY